MKRRLTETITVGERVLGAVFGLCVAVPPLLVWLLYEGGADSYLQLAFVVSPIVGSIVGAIAGRWSGYRRGAAVGAIIGATSLALVYLILIPGEPLIAVLWAILGANLWGAWGAAASRELSRLVVKFGVQPK